MMGHFLFTLTKAQEDRVLTGQMACYPDSQGACLVQTAVGDGKDTAEASRATSVHGVLERAIRDVAPRPVPASFARVEDAECHYHAYRCYQPLSVGTQYDHACWRFGSERVNEALRSRVLCNQLRRSLAVVRATAGV